VATNVVEDLTVESVLRDRDWRLLIGKELRHATDGRTEPVVDPSTGRQIAEVPWAGPADVDAACRAGQEAFPAWSALTVKERGKHLKEFGRLLGERADEFALLDAIDSGNPLRAMRAEVDASIAHIDNWCSLATSLNGVVIPASRDNLHYTTYRPYGVVARIFPFNHPLLFAVTRPIASLLAGNTCVLKPAEQTPLVALALGDLALEAFPPGVVNILSGGVEAGDALVRHGLIRRIGFIGGTKTGRAIQRAAADEAVKNVTLELGGKNALIVMPDADFDATVEGAVYGMNLGVSQGQSCGSTSRAFVHESLYEDFVNAVAAKFQEVQVGRAYDEGTDMGPVVSSVQLERVKHYIATGREQARLVAGGDRPAGVGDGFFVEPTLFADVPRDATIAQEEIFGPVLAMSSWRDYDEVIAAANSVEYGLTAGVWTQDLTLAHRTAERLEAGYVWINGAATHYWGTPFGGTKESGLGREESIEELISYLEQKVTHVGLGQANSAFERVLGRVGT
jgi:betaine-aldehyde dehydrogenase